MGVELALYRQRIGLRAARCSSRRRHRHEHLSSSAAGDQSGKRAAMTVFIFIVLVGTAAGRSGCNADQAHTFYPSAGTAVTDIIEGPLASVLPLVHSATPEGVWAGVSGQRSPSVQYSFDHSGILLLAGDVELNPGPNEREEFAPAHEENAAAKSQDMTEPVSPGQRPGKEGNPVSSTPPVQPSSEAHKTKAQIVAAADERPKKGKDLKKSAKREEKKQAKSPMGVEEFAMFDDVYNKKGTVQVFPDVLETKVTLFKKATPARPPPPTDKVRHHARLGKQQTETKTTDDILTERHHEGGEREGTAAGKSGVETQSSAEEKPTLPTDPNPSVPEKVQAEKKRKKIKEPQSFLLDEEKLENPDVRTQLEAEDCEFLVLRRTGAALEKIADPNDPPVFILHNQDLVVKTKAGKSEGEKDVLVLHPTLGVLVLEVKGTEKTDIFSRFDKATTQLLHAQTSIQREMGDLLGTDAIVLTIALPKLRPEDAIVITRDAQERKMRKQRPSVSALAAATAPQPEMTSHTGTPQQVAMPSSGSGTRPDGNPSFPSPTAPPPCTTPADVTDTPPTSLKSDVTDISSATRKSDVTDTPSTSRKSGKQNKGDRKSGTGSVSQQVKKELLEDHPEVHLMCGYSAEDYSEWVRELQKQRAATGHAFKGSTAQERLDNFKRACMRRCSFAGLRPGQSVKASAVLHSRWLLTKEQLRVRDCQSELLHISGPPGSGKTLLLAERARRWLREGRGLALAVAWVEHDVLLHHLVLSVCKEKADLARVSKHPHCRSLLRSLATASTDDPVFVILDELDLADETYGELLAHVRAGRVHGLWTACTRPLPEELETGLRGVGGTTVQLRLCLRCPQHVVAWANSVKPEEEPSLLTPRVPVARELGVDVELISHFDHSEALYWNKCSACRAGVLAFFSSLGLLQERTPSALTWRDAIVLVTGERCDREFVAKWLQELGLPAVVEKKKRYDFAAVLGGAASTEEDRAWRRRVLSGEDRQGRPVLHILDGEDFRGMEKMAVLLVHADMDERDRDESKQYQRDDILSRSRALWFHTATRCQGRLVVLATTPSPVLPLLEAPCLELISRFEPTVLTHHNHSWRGLSFWECRQCGQRLAQRLQALDVPVCTSPAPASYSQAAVVLTGCSSDGEGTAWWLQQLGIPAVFEEPRMGVSFDYNEVEVEDWRRRVKAGVDSNGQPALHVVEHLYAMLPPAPVVVLIHRDDGDEKPELQSQGRWDSRLQWHLYCWSRALRHCKAAIIVATTPSPLVDLLQPPSPSELSSIPAAERKDWRVIYRRGSPGLQPLKMSADTTSLPGETVK